MARDFPIRRDLAAIGLPDRAIRVLEKAAQLVDVIEQQAALTTDVEAINTAVGALQEADEDANITLGTLDSRIDAFEVLAPFVRQDQTTAWVDATGTLSRATFATYTAPVISNPPTQAEVQALANAVAAHSQRLAALINDLRAISALT